MDYSDDLVQAAVAGDEEALSSLLERHGVGLRQALAISPKWRSIIEADDVMQVTYLEAFLRIASLKQLTTAGFIVWLKTIAENNLRDAIRHYERDKRDQRRVILQPDDSYTALVERVSSGSTTPSRVAGRREVQQIVEDALRRLPTDYEKVLRLCELECKTAPEAASLLGRSDGAVRMLLLRARDRLREILMSTALCSTDTA